MSSQPTHPHLPQVWGLCGPIPPALLRTVGLVFVLLCLASPAQAVLFRVGPVDVPSPPGHGFPLWYQDTKGLVLDLCLPRNQAQLDAGVCLILPPDQDPVAGINLPLSFPSNFPDEAFYWNGGALINFPAGGRATLVLGLEAAFGGGAPAANDQITFGRIRIIVDAPVNGTYTVTHPYGVKTFPDVQAGKRAITFTDDVGIGAPGDFTGALQSGVGPFLVPALTEGGTPKALVTIGGEQFLSDTLLPEFVTGSPFNTNYFEVCVTPAANLDGSGHPCIRVNQFTIMGKVHAGAVGSPLTVTEATYSRDSATAAHVDVFATATPGPGEVAPQLSLGDAAGTHMHAVFMLGPTTTLGEFYEQGVPLDPRSLPAAVIVTNIADNPPTSVTHRLADQVTITQALYDPASRALTITATSSDKLVPATLVAVALPGSTAEVALLPTSGGPGSDPALRSLTYPVPGNVPPVPPATVTVRSTAGGQATATVATSLGGSFALGAPVAVDDTVDHVAGIRTIDIAVLANDSDADTTVLASKQPTVLIVTQPTHAGSAEVQPNGSVSYTPANPALVGEDTFTYRAIVGNRSSNVATVTVLTAQPSGGPVPIAVDDGPFSGRAGTVLPLSVVTLLANDVANGATINAATFAIAGTPVGGTVAVTPAPPAAPTTVTFTGTAPGAGSFQYTIANATGGRSAPATVSITILPATDTLDIVSARYRTLTRRWDVTGTATVPGPGNAVTVVLVRRVNNTDTVIGTLGTAPVDATGAWALRVLLAPSNVRAQPGDSVRATSTAGGTDTLTVNVTN